MKTRVLILLLVLQVCTGIHCEAAYLPVQQSEQVESLSAVPEDDRGETRDERSLRYTGLFKKLFEIFEKSPTLIVVLYIVILYSIIALITLTVFILFNRSRIAREEELKESLNEQYQQLLIDYLFDEEKRGDYFKRLRRIAYSEFNRQILINQIIELSINMQGKSTNTLRQLYLDIGLMDDSIKKAYSRKWHENIKGIRELAFMNIRSENDQIIKYLNSSNQILRMEAQIALVRLSDEHPYEFLDFLEKPFALWEQITLHELVAQHGLSAPEFSHWFESENLSIVKFSLQMVAWFKQKESVDHVIRMLHHDNEEVRYTAIRCCGELGASKVLGELENIYYGQSYKNRLEILRAFARIPEEAFIDFLNGVLDKEEDVQLQILATKAMENMDEPGISRLIKLMKSKSEYRNYQIIIRHVLDGRIY